MLMKKLLWTACAAIALTASAGINAEEYVVGTGATYRPFEYETPQKEPAILIIMPQSNPHWAAFKQESCEPLGKSIS